MAKKIARAHSAPKSAKKTKAVKKASPKKTPKRASSVKATPSKKSPVAKKSSTHWKAPFTKTIKQWHEPDQYFQMNAKYAK